MSLLSAIRDFFVIKKDLVETKKAKLEIQQLPVEAQDRKSIIEKASFDNMKKYDVKAQKLEMNFLDHMKQHWIGKAIVFAVACIGTTWAVLQALYIGPRDFEINQKKELISQLQEKVNALEKQLNSANKENINLEVKVRHFEMELDNLRAILGKIPKKEKVESPKPQTTEKIIISGNVCNEITKKPVSGARVSLSGADNPEYTDSFGNFRLQVSEQSLETAILIVVARGYQPYSEIIKLDKSSISKPIALKPGG